MNRGLRTCPYMNAHSFENKQLQSVNFIQVTDMWWDSSHDWSAVMDGYRFFRKNRQGKQEGEVVLYAGEQLRPTELC